MDEDLKLPPLPEPDGACDLMDANPGDAWSEELVREYARAAVLAERERCAKLCDEYEAKKYAAYKHGNSPERASDYVQGLSDGAGDCAAAIRGHAEEKQ
jgi:hypothetical protein